MKRVLVESPYAAPTPEGIKRNVRYARACAKHSLSLGEAPFASHLFYTQVLDDKKPDERDLGINAGLVWGQAAELTAVYIDLGFSKGMAYGVAAAIAAGRQIDVRGLHGTDEAKRTATEVLKFIQKTASEIGKAVALKDGDTKVVGLVPG